MPHTSANGIDIYYERAGSGPPLVFISGTSGDLRVRPNMLDGPLPKQFDVLAFDQRGLGQSDKPDGSYTMADYADDAAALMADQGWAQAFVLGVSFGGMVAQELVLRHPERVAKLVLACTSPGGAGGASFPFHEVDHFDRTERARMLIPVSDTRRDDAWRSANPEQYAQFVAAAVAEPYADEPGRREGARRQLEARRLHDAWDRLDQIRCPVLIAGGRYDGIALPLTQERMAERIPNARLSFFEGGHLFMIQDRAAVAAMADFLLAG